MSSLTFLSSIKFDARFLRVGDVGRTFIHLEKNGDVYSLMFGEQVAYSIERPFLPEDAWSIKKYQPMDLSSISIDGSVPGFVKRDSGLLAKTLCALPEGEYGVKKVCVKPSDSNEILLGNEFGCLDFGTSEYINTGIYYSAFLGCTDEELLESPRIFLGLPILNYTAVTDLAAVLFFDIGAADSGERESAVVLCRSGRIIIDHFEDYHGYDVEMSEEKWAGRKSLEFYHLLK